MSRTLDVLELAPAVRSRQQLLAHGWTERAIDDGVRRRTLHHIRRGWYMDAAEWDGLWPEGRHLAHVIAVARDASGGAAASHTSAAVAWKIPLYRVAPPRVHLTCDVSAHISSGRDVVRHLSPLPPEDVVVLQGIRVTSLERTTFDLARTLPVEAAVACADAAERQMALRGREWDTDAVASWHAALLQRIEAAYGARGIRQARRVIEFADGRAQLPGESVSRVQLARLGYSPRLQVPVPAPNGWYYVDFGLDEVNAFGEFDGKSKYLDEAMRRGMPLERVLLEEKQREDWIRGRSQRRFARWADEHIGTEAQLGRRLSSFGIHPPR